jgi:hypothetical protein
MQHRPHLLAAAFVAALLALAGPAHARPKVAVLGLEVIGQGATDQKAIEAARSLTRELRREATRPSGRFDLAPNSNKDLLEIKMLSDCSDEGRRCMSDVGKQLGAERLIYGKLERKKTGYELSLKLLNTETTELEAQADTIIPFSDMGTAASIGRHTRGLYGKLTGAPEEGIVAITANAERGTVLVNGQIRTSLSAGSARVSGLTAGTHTITIEAEGFDRYQTDITIGPGETRTLRASLLSLDHDADHDEPGRGWRIAFWSGAVATGVTGGGFLVSLMSMRSAQSDLNAASARYIEDPMDPIPPSMNRVWADACNDFNVDQSMVRSENRQAVEDVLDACDRGKRWSTLTGVFGYPAVAFGVLTAVAGYMGYVAPRGKTTQERSARRRGERRAPRREVTITPSVGPDLLGAGLEIQF